MFNRLFPFSRVSPLCLVLLAGVLVLFNTACQEEVAVNSTAVENASPSETQSESLEVAIIPAISPEKQQAQLQALSSYLEATLGQPVNFQVESDYDTVVDLLVEGTVDVAYLGPFTYIKARDRDPQIQPIVAAINLSTGRPWYNSLIVTKANSRINSLQDLKGKRFSFVSQSSTSGYLVPSVEFQKMGLTPNSDFAEVQYSGSHDKSLALLEANAVDAIAIDSEVYQSAINSGEIQAQDYPIIWTSDPIPTEPIAVSGQISDALVLELKKSFINAPEGLVDISGAESAGYTLVEDIDYEPIRKVARTLSVNKN